MERYKVTCLKCKGEDYLSIFPDGRTVMEKMMQTPFWAVRKRKDGKYGFECSCGNDTRLCKEEAPELEKLVYGTPMGIEKVRQALAKRTKETFRMETA